MTPTPAQIEAALNTFNHCMQKGQNRRQAITAALTAAAEIEMKGFQMRAYTSARDIADAAYAEAHPAAAEVGEPKDAIEWQAWSMKVEADTIERCAQVVKENGEDWQTTLIEMRALKQGE